ERLPLQRLALETRDHRRHVANTHPLEVTHARGDTCAPKIVYVLLRGEPTRARARRITSRMSVVRCCKGSVRHSFVFPANSEGTGGLPVTMPHSAANRTPGIFRFYAKVIARCGLSWYKRQQPRFPPLEGFFAVAT